MAHQLVFNVKDVAGYSPPGTEDSYISKLLVDNHSVGSKRMVVNHFTLKVGKATPTGSHPESYDELYYVLCGCARLALGEPPQLFDLEPGAVAFIPACTRHALDSTGTEDLELLTVMSAQMVEGANPLYDARLREWGTSFRMAEEK